MSDVLVIYWHPVGTKMRPAVEHHLRALEAYAAQGRVVYLNSFDRSAPDKSLRVGAVILHTTFCTQRWGDWFGLFKQGFEWVSALDCTKIAIPQDEYDHSEILDEWLFELGVQTIFSNFGPDERRLLYPILADRANFNECLTGYIDPNLAEQILARGVPSIDGRTNDVVYRASHLPYWFGAHGQMKHEIGDMAAARCEQLGLVANISTSYDDVITGDAWFDFLMSGRTVIGAESGSSAIDRRGEIQTAIRAMLLEEPQLSFADVVGRLPRGWDGHALTAISPRHFEAVMTSTAQLLVRGRYSDVLIADEHYIPIEPDLSNLEQVLDRSRDTPELERIARRAYEDIYLSGRFTYRQFARELAEVAYADGRLVPTPARAGSRAPGSKSPFPRLRVRETQNAVSELCAAIWAPVHRLVAATAQHAFRARIARAVAGTIAGHPPVRMASLAALRRGHHVRHVLRDLVRLAIIDAHAAAAPDSANASWAVRIERRGDALAIISTPAGEGAASQALITAGLKHVVWDHSLVGTSVPFFPADPARGVLGLGEDGTYEFASFSSVVADDPDLIHRAFAAVLQAR
ncbi:MAG: hypothetical protein M3P18_00365 [Actinomycetota bacterium]|nr:hypothetical protein [Actinomycetota bacterium]